MSPYGLYWQIPAHETEVYPKLPQKSLERVPEDQGTPEGKGVTQNGIMTKIHALFMKCLLFTQEAH